jgi:hypothetical protein
MTTMGFDINTHVEVKIDGAIYKPYQLGFLFGNSVENFLEYREDYPAEVEDIRIVYWFA